MSHIRALDGLRGYAALWVLLGHASLLSGARLKIIDQAGLAVDLFMLLSGFLMCFHYMERRGAEPWERPKTWMLFWTRRFFRIAPLYYVALLAALLAGPVLGESRALLGQYVHSALTDMDRYNDTSLVNVLAHVTFVFGFSPTYGFRTALPDWSIGLEMAFYAAFPFLMIVAARFSLVVSAVVVSLGCLALSRLMPEFYDSFQQPSFLPMKLPMFYAGMLIAAALRETPRRAWIDIAVALFLVLLPIYSVKNAPLYLAIRLICAITLVGVTSTSLIPEMLGARRAASWAGRVLGNRLAMFLGDMSYAVYLVHLLVLVPVAAWVDSHLLPGHSRLAFLAIAGIVIAVVYPLAWILHRTIERPGIALGKKVAQRFRRQAPIAAATEAV
jgi:peptidoglycan/LPS O-acetylase OafA/YrhL